MKKDLVTIITPCYNGEKYLKRYFDSIVNQTYKNIELIFINDGSKDKTESIIKEYEGKIKQKGYEFKYIYQENAGQAEAVNKALPNISGEFLYWMDSDDYLEPDSIEKLVNFLQKNENYNIVRGKVRIVKDGKEIKIGKPKKNESEYIFENYIFGINTYCYPGIFMIRMEEFDKNIKDRKIYSLVGVGQNWQLILPNTYNQKCGFVDSIVYNYNIIENSHSRTELKKFEDEINKINSDIDVLYHILTDLKVLDKYREKIELLYDRSRIRVGLKYDKYNYINEILENEKKNYKNYKENKKYWILKNKAFYRLYRKVKNR